MTTYRDQMATCEACGKEFVFRVEEQRKLDQEGKELEPPEKCPDCRVAESLGPGLHAGVVRWYRADKHFGFIDQGNGNDIFFHRSGVTGDPESVLHEDAQVWYEAEMTDRGPQAINVHPRE